MMEMCDETGLTPFTIPTITQINAYNILLRLITARGGGGPAHRQSILRQAGDIADNYYNDPDDDEHEAYTEIINELPGYVRRNNKTVTHIVDIVVRLGIDSLEALIVADLYPTERAKLDPVTLMTGQIKPLEICYKCFEQDH